MGKLTAVAVKAAMANPGTYQDGDGLVLRVDKRGGAYRVLRHQRDVKRQDIGLGIAKQMALAEADTKAHPAYAPSASSGDSIGASTGG